MKAHEFIRARRLKLGLSHEGLARLIGVTRTTIQNWEKDPDKGGSFPTRKFIPALARALQVDDTRIDPRQAPGVAPSLSLDTFIIVPRISLLEITASNIDQVIKNAGDSVNLDERVEDAFAVTVIDDSMAPRFAPGDLVVARRTLYPQQDDVVLFASPEGTAVFRNYTPRGLSREGHEVYDLVPNNPEYLTTTIRSEDEGRIVGVAIEHRKKLRSGQ